MTRKKMQMQKALVLIVAILLAIYAISVIFILAWGFITSLKSHLDFGAPHYNVIGFPTLNKDLPYNSCEQFWSWKNYSLVFKNFKFDEDIAFYRGGTLVEHAVEANYLTILVYTILYAGVGSLILAFVPAIVAYICAKYKFFYSKVIYLFALFALTMSIVGAYPSELTLLKNLGMYDTFWGNWIQKLSFTGTYFFVYLAYFEGVSDTYAEAAEIDGAGQFQTMVRIVMPLAKTMISTVWLLVFVNLWNDYNTPLLYMPTKPTMAYAVYFLVFRDSVRELKRVPVQIAACMLVALPILVVFLILRNKMMANISLGGIKE